MKYRLRYAEKGVPTSPADVAKKKPYLTGWQEKATTNRQQITAESNRWPKAGILTPTGSRYGPHGRWVLDVDDFEDLVRLERVLGVKLREISTEVRTQSGRLQIHFLWPEGEELRNSVGKTAKDGFEGLDVRGEGGLVLLPPSAGYSFLNDLSTAQAPPELVEWARSRKRPRRREEADKSRPRTEVPKAEKVREGGRNDFLVSECGRLHDGTRDLAQLIEDLDTINRERCDPPWERWEIEKQARSIFELPPCSPAGKPDPERDELVEALGQTWFENPAKGIGGKTDSSIERALLRKAAEVGTVEPGVGLRVSFSVRALAEEAKCHPNTVVNYTKRAMLAGRLRKDPSTVRGQSGAFVLLDPRLGCDTLNNAPSPVERDVVGVSQPSHTPVSELRTEHYRWRGLVGKGRERALCFLEAFGPMTSKELARRLGWSRGGDVRRRYLEPLVGLGLVEDRGGGVYALAGDHRERSEELRRESYSTVQLRVRRVRSVEGLWVHQVAESGMVASEAERDDLDRGRHARQREAYRLRLAL